MARSRRPSPGSGGSPVENPYPENLSEETRGRWRTLAKSSTYFLGKLIGFRDLSPDLHGEMSEWIIGPTIRKLGLAPRDHFKSSVWTISENLRKVINDPNIRILIINETITNAMHFLSRIKAVPEKNQIFRWLFPEVLPDINSTRWSQTEAEFRRSEDYPEATIEVIGVGGASTSRHYNVIHEDDLIGKQAAESKAEMDKAIDQHKLAESLLNSPKDQIITVGTRWSPFDLIEWMLKNEEDLDIFSVGCWKPDGTPIFPERFSREYLEGLERKYGPSTFALQYLNKVIASGVTELDLDWIHWYRIGQDRRGDPVIILENHGEPETRIPLADLTIFQTIDPGLSPESKDARTANIVVGLTPQRPYRIILLEASAWKVDPKQLVDRSWESYQRWHPIASGIEVVAAQRVFFYYIPTVYPDFPLIPLKTDTHQSKFSRIRSFSPFARQGRFYCHRSQQDFLLEWQTFPVGRTVDLLDALAYAPQIWSPPEGSDTDGDGIDLDDLYLQGGGPTDEGRSEITGY